MPQRVSEKSPAMSFVLLLHDDKNAETTPNGVLEVS
jgi:hypothetical protein